MTALLAPRRSVIGRGCRLSLSSLLPDGPVVLVRGRSVPWVDDWLSGMRASGRFVAVVVADGEPSLPQVEAALNALAGVSPRRVVAIGGGSAVDLGKALSALMPAAGHPLDHLEVVGAGKPLEADPIPMIAVPTTAGTGAEATKNAVIDVPQHKRKVSLRDPRMVPDVALLDAELTTGTPWPVTLASGMDAVTQVIEPFLSSRARPDIDIWCMAAIGPGLRALTALSRGEDPFARDVLLRAAHISGIALANAGLGAVHGLAGVIGGESGAPHGAICARVLPPVLAANRHACKAAGHDMAKFEVLDAIVARAFDVAGTPAPAEHALSAFLESAGMPRLRAVTGQDMDLERIARLSQGASSMKANPVPLSVDTLQAILADA